VQCGVGIPYGAADCTHLYNRPDDSEAWIHNRCLDDYNGVDVEPSKEISEMPRKKKPAATTPPKGVPTPMAPQNLVPPVQTQLAQPAALTPPPQVAAVTMGTVQVGEMVPQPIPVAVTNPPGQFDPFTPDKLMDPFNSEVMQHLEMKGVVPTDVLKIEDISDPSGMMAQIPAKIGVRQYYSAMRDFADQQVKDAKAAIEVSVLLSGAKTYRVGRYVVRQNKDSAAVPKGSFNMDRAKEVAVRYGVPVEGGDLLMSLLKWLGVVPVDGDPVKSLMTHVGISKDDIEGCYDDIPSSPGAIVVTDLAKK